MSTAIRALVMLAFLVGLPAAWVYYGPLPAGAQRVADRFVHAAKEAVGWNEATPERARTVATLTRTEAAPPFSPAAGWPTVSPAPSIAQRLEPMLAQLRQFGVAEYALERWGSGGQWYRFRCEMPLAASDELTQQFEAIAVDPQTTVEQVVAEVASWRLAQGDGLIR